ncbi:MULTISPECIES: hypothetical protein [unclassified Micromonospora]|uniref:hypothetical protein n=1 Tax=unclassified Micromonospora TaxID=2617518 RepID=UPI003A8BF0BA
MGEKEQSGKGSDSGAGTASEAGAAWSAWSFGGAWRQHALARALYLEHQSRLLCSDKDDHRLREACKFVRVDVSLARQAAGSVWPFRGSLERTWSHIHAAELVLLKVADEERLKGWSSSVLELAKKRLHENDCRLVKLRELCGRDGIGSHERRVTGGWRRIFTGKEKCAEVSELRYAMMAALVGSYTAINSWYSRVRGVRNILISVTMLALALVLCLGIWGYKSPDVLSLCFGTDPSTLVCPHDPLTKDQGMQPTAEDRDRQAEPDRVDVTLVLAFGFIGAVLSGIPALARLHRSAVPYDLRLTSAALKLPAGALSAFVGVTFIRGEFVPGLTQLDTGAQILAWSAVFGVSQYAITRLVDNKTWEIASDQRGNPEGDDDSKSGSAAGGEGRARFD